jgi:hypothetical protein
MRSRDGRGYISGAELKAMLKPYLDACRAICPAHKRPELEARILEGNWYALQFVRRLTPAERAQGGGIRQMSIDDFLGNE